MCTMTIKHLKADAHLLGISVDGMEKQELRDAIRIESDKRSLAMKHPLEFFEFRVDTSIVPSEEDTLSLAELAKEKLIATARENESLFKSKAAFKRATKEVDNEAVFNATIYADKSNRDRLINEYIGADEKLAIVARSQSGGKVVTRVIVEESGRLPMDCDINSTIVACASIKIQVDGPAGTFNRQHTTDNPRGLISVEYVAKLLSKQLTEMRANLHSKAHFRRVGDVFVFEIEQDEVSRKRAREDV